MASGFESAILGSQISLQTPDESVSGVVFGRLATEDHQVLILQQPGSTPFQANFRILKREQIVAVSDLQPNDGWNLETLPIIDVKRGQEREERAIHAAELDKAKIGVNVTAEGQAVFDALCKTLPCRWQQKTIVVLDEVFIAEPYKPDNCTSTHPDDTTTMDRVKKVLVAEWAKLQGAL